MDFIKMCLDERSGALMDELQAAGFSQEQAKQFLPVAVSHILDSMQDIGVAQTICRLQDDPAELVRSIQDDVLARDLSISLDQVATGIDAMAPVFLEVFSINSKGIVGSIISMIGGSTSKLVSSTKKSFS